MLKAELINEEEWESQKTSLRKPQSTQALGGFFPPRALSDRRAVILRVSGFLLLLL